MPSIPTIDGERRTLKLRPAIPLLWLAWAVLLLGFQSLVQARLELKRPDHALAWTARETGKDSQNDQPYLIDPFMNGQVSWDSEFYLSIATAGYDDPAVRAVDAPGHTKLSLNYAFLPLYPLTMRVLAVPLRVIGLTPIATATLAGVLVSLLGALAGMIALHDLARDELGDSGGLRAAFYLIAFPTGFFLAQVYTEGLFVGLAFGSLAMLRRRRWVWAALLAALAAWTRAVGGALLVPLGWALVQEARREPLVPWAHSWKRLAGHGLLSLAPLAAFVTWKASPLGRSFEVVERTFFRRGTFDLAFSLQNWSRAFQSVFRGQPQTQAYYLIEFGAIAVGLAACLATLRRHPDLAAFSLLVMAISLTSGPAQGMQRYVLTAPSLFVFLSRLGKHPAFDRAWSVGSTLLMGMLATLFTFDFWVG